VGLARD